MNEGQNTNLTLDQGASTLSALKGLNKGSDSTIQEIAESLASRAQAPQAPLQAATPVNGTEQAQQTTNEPPKQETALEQVARLNAEQQQRIAKAQEKGQTPYQEGTAPTEGNAYTNTEMQTPSSESFTVNNPLFGGEKSFGATEKPVNFNDLNDLNAYIKNNLGSENVVDFLGKYSEVQNQLAKAKDLETQYENYQNTINGLPEDLVKAIYAASSGEDYKVYFKEGPLDYSKNIADLTSKDLINAYFPGQVNETMFNAANPDHEDYNEHTASLLKTLDSQARNQFLNDQQGKQTELQRLTESNTQRAESYRNSVKESLPSIKKQFPDASDAYINNISKKLENGDFLSHFQDKKGNLLPDAAVKLAMIEDGFSLFDQMSKKLTETAQTQANQNALLVGRDTPANLRSSGQATTNEVRPEALKKINDLLGGLNKTKTY